MPSQLAYGENGHQSAVESEQNKTMCPTCNGGLSSLIQAVLVQCTHVIGQSFYTWNLGSIWVLLSFPEASLGVSFSREKSYTDSQSLWNWVLMAREVGTNTWGTHGWMAELTFKFQSLHF